MTISTAHHGEHGSQTKLAMMLTTATMTAPVRAHSRPREQPESGEERDHTDNDLNRLPRGGDIELENPLPGHRVELVVD